MSAEKITLVVPAHVEHGRVVRLTAAAIANAVGLSVIDVEDVRIAAEEGFVYASETLDGKGEVTIVFLLGTLELGMEFSLGDTLVEEDVDEPSNAYAAFILGTVCDEYEITDGEAPKLRLLKRAEGAV